MRTSPTQEQLQGVFALLRIVLKVLDETGGNVTMTNVPILGGTTADIHLKHYGSLECRGGILSWTWATGIRGRPRGILRRRPPGTSGGSSARSRKCLRNENALIRIINYY